MITKKKANGKGNNTQNSCNWRTRLFIFLPWCSLSLAVVRFFFFLLSCFHYLKRTEHTSILVTIQMLTQDISTLLQQMHTQQFCSTIIFSITRTKASAEVFLRVFVKYIENPPSITLNICEIRKWWRGHSMYHAMFTWQSVIWFRGFSVGNRNNLHLMVGPEEYVPGKNAHRWSLVSSLL